MKTLDRLINNKHDHVIINQRNKNLRCFKKRGYHRRSASASKGNMFRFKIWLGSQDTTESS